MTDDQTWQAPGAPTPVPPHSAPPHSAPPQSAPQQQPPPPSPYFSTPPPPPPSPYSPAAQNPAAPGWTPPPKPGLIPLRPLDFGTLLGASFRVLRRNPRPTFGAAILLQSVTMVATLLLVGGLTAAAVMRVSSATANDQSAIIAGTVGMGVIGALLTVVLSLVSQALLQGIIVVEVARGSLGEKLPLRKLWGFVKGRAWALVGWAAIIAAALLLAMLVFGGVIAVLIVTMGAAGVAIGILIGIFGALALLVLGVWLGTKLCLVPSALVLERLKLGAAITRSWSLTKNSFWKVFGIQILVAFILGTATNIALIPFSIAAPLLMALLDPNGTNSSFVLIAMGAVYILQIVFTVVLAAITSIISTATTSLIYLDLRMRKEGLDLELTRFVESRQAGGVVTENPYLRPELPAPDTAGYTFA